MARYERPSAFPTGIDNSRNWLNLRLDIRWAFDQGWFAIVPKPPGGSANSDPRWMVHALPPASHAFIDRYHGRLVDELEEGSRPYLFCRFAWAIFQHVELLHERNRSLSQESLTRAMENLSFDHRCAVGSAAGSSAAGSSEGYETAGQYL
jgi:hypothetical protein